MGLPGHPFSTPAERLNLMPTRLSTGKGIKIYRIELKEIHGVGEKYFLIIPLLTSDYTLPRPILLGLEIQCGVGVCAPIK